jgi:Mrp family chromosome partitioning ATPase
MLRANLYRWLGAGGGTAGKALLITSPNPGDGKTTCVLALAALLAADNKRVLVVDLDLRKPNHPGRPSGVGGQGALPQVLRNECSWADAARPVNVVNGQYLWLGSGGVAPAELLSSPAMAAFIGNARSYCDFVLLDVPSFPVVSDALVVAPHVDAVLSIFRVQNSSRKLAVEHMRGLAGISSVHAIVINGVELDVSPSTEPAAGERRPQPSPQFQKRLSSLWWVSVLILAAGGAALLLFSSPPVAGLAGRLTSELRR